MMFPGHAQNLGRCAFTSSSGRRAWQPQGDRCHVSAKGASISQVMMIVALAAANMAILRATPKEIFTFPSISVLMGTIDFVILWKLILKRSLRAFHYTFMIVFVIAYLVMAVLADTERIHPLGLLVRWYQQHTGEETNAIALAGFVRFGEIWMAAFLSFILAWVIGLNAAWLERRRNWDIAAFFRGALVGFVIANLLAMIDGAVWGWVVESPGRFIGRWVLLAVCLILGGWMDLSKLRSSIPGRGEAAVIRRFRRNDRLVEHEQNRGVVLVDAAFCRPFDCKDVLVISTARNPRFTR